MGPKHYYIFDEIEQPIDIGKYSSKAFMSFFLLFCHILPLDMAITTLAAKIMQTILVMNDSKMIDFEISCQEKEIVGCQVKNLTMLEDFAQINYLFCDKTGTLTKNQLIFKFLAVGGHVLERDSDDINFQDFAKRVKNHSHIDEQFINFWRCLCICHDVIQMRIK